MRHADRVLTVDVEGHGSAAQTTLAYDAMGDRHSAFLRDFVPRVSAMGASTLMAPDGS